MARILHFLFPRTHAPIEEDEKRKQEERLQALEEESDRLAYLESLRSTQERRRSQ